MCVHGWMDGWMVDGWVGGDGVGRLDRLGNNGGLYFILFLICNRVQNASPDLYKQQRPVNRSSDCKKLFHLVK